jgi:predicted choloylglycine hydrolase
VINEKTVQLVRNYDYHPDLMEGTLLLSAWHGKKVIATSDCLIGVVDGMNEDGLAISLTFGGRKEVGVGFGIPFILRYVLEFCGNVQEAVQALCSIPSHMSYNVTVVDRKGACKTLFLSPDRNPVITDAAFTTNHQGRVDWPENAVFNKTIERSDYLKELMDGQSPDANEMSDAFLRPPLYNTQYDQGFGTLYTAVYNPSERTIKIRWPQQDIQVSFDNFKEQYKLIEFNCPTAISPVQPVRHVARVSKKSKQKQWYGQELAVNILDDSVVVVNTTEENKKLNNFDHRAIGRGEISWEIIADYWANVGKKYWEKWQN